MMDNSHDKKLEEQLRNALSTPFNTDFDAWRERHGHAVAHLNPIVTERYRRRRRIVIRIVSGTAAMFVFAAALLTLVPERTSFAEVIATINDAQAMTWTKATVERFYSKDGSRTWLRIRKRTTAYKHPGLYRHTRYDEAGNVSRVTIIDQQRGESLALDMKARKTLPPPSVEIEPNIRRPFAWVADMLSTDPIEFVGQQNVNGRKVNVIRFQNEKRSRDVWIDPESKQFVGWSDPGADQIDLLNLPDRDNPAEDSFSSGTMLGGFTHGIVYDAKLVADLFSLSPPAGFEVVEYPPLPPLPTVTEAEMAEWLGIMARVNNDTFPDTMPWHEFKDQFNAAEAKDKAERTEAEQRLSDAYRKHHSNGNRMPMWDFQHGETIPGSFRYLGKGVKLGNASRIVCWYKLKTSGKYRAVYGDLTVKDVQTSELPIPVK